MSFAKKLKTQTLCTVEMKEYLSNTIAEIKEAGLYKEERLIESAQQAAISVKGKQVLNFCANNYLGLSDHPRLIGRCQEDDGPPRIRYVVRSLHLRNARYPQRTRSSYLGLFPNRGHHPIRCLL